MPNYSAIAKTDSDSVSWHATLFENVGNCVLAQLMFAEREHDATVGDFDTKRMIVCVACYLHRVASPLAAYLQNVVEQACQHGIFKSVRASNCQVRVVDSLTGPTADHVRVIRHRRKVGAADQHKGLQGDPKRFYVAATRGRSSLTVWLEQEPVGILEIASTSSQLTTRARKPNSFFSNIYGHIANLLGRARIFNLRKPPCYLMYWVVTR